MFLGRVAVKHPPPPRSRDTGHLRLLRHAILTSSGAGAPFLLPTNKVNMSYPSGHGTLISPRQGSLSKNYKKVSFVQVGTIFSFFFFLPSLQPSPSALQLPASPVSTSPASSQPQPALTHPHQAPSHIFCPRGLPLPTCPRAISVSELSHTPTSHGPSRLQPTKQKPSPTYLHKPPPCLPTRPPTSTPALCPCPFPTRAASIRPTTTRRAPIPSRHLRWKPQ